MSGLDRRRPLFGREMVVRVAAVWLAAIALSLAFAWSKLAALDLPGPDDALRLVQVRDLLAGQGWFDLTQYRIDAASGGIAMHWSRLVDAPIALIAALLAPLIGQGAAEVVALAAVPALTLLAVMLLAGRIAWRMLGLKAVVATGIVVAVAAPLANQLRPGRIDHHGWQIALALVAINALIARDERKGGLVLGTALAAWMAISIEGLPLAAAFIGIAALRWLRDPQDDTLMTHAMAALAAASALLFAFTRGFTDLAAHCDAIGPVHLSVFLLGAASLFGLARLEPRSVAVRLGGLAATAAAAFALLAFSAPECATGGFAQVDPAVRDGWLATIAEGLPMWQQEPTIILLTVVPAALGIWGMMHHASLTHAWLRRFWLEYAALTLAALGVAMLVSRAGSVAVAFAAPVLGWQLARWVEVVRTSPVPRQRIAAIAGCTLILVPALPFTLGTLLTSSAVNASPAAAPEILEKCEADWAAFASHAGRGEEVLAPLDLGPQILLRSRAGVVATSHHRGDRGIKALLEVFAASPQEARTMLAARGTKWVATCTGHHELYFYALEGDETLAGALRGGNAPAWLEPVIAPRSPADLALWRIRTE